MSLLIDPVGIPMFHTQLVVSPAVFQHVSEIFMQVRHWQICLWRPAWSRSALGIAKGIASNVSLALTAKLPAAENRLTWETNSRKPLFYRVKNQGGPWVSCDLSFIQFRDSFNAQAANFSYWPTLAFTCLATRFLPAAVSARQGFLYLITISRSPKISITELPIWDEDSIPTR